MATVGKVDGLTIPKVCTIRIEFHVLCHRKYFVPKTIDAPLYIEYNFAKFQSDYEIRRMAQWNLNFE